MACGAQVPSACFVQPPLAYVGATEEDAIAEYAGDIDVYVSKFKPMKNTISEREERTLMKLLVHAATDQARPLPRPGCPLPAGPHACMCRTCLYLARLWTNMQGFCQKGLRAGCALKMQITQR